MIKIFIILTFIHICHLLMYRTEKYQNKMIEKYKQGKLIYAENMKLSMKEIIFFVFTIILESIFYKINLKINFAMFLIFLLFIKRLNLKRQNKILISILILIIAFIINYFTYISDYEMAKKIASLTFIEIMYIFFDFNQRNFVILEYKADELLEKCKNLKNCKEN